MASTAVGPELEALTLAYGDAMALMVRDALDELCARDIVTREDIHALHLQLAAYRDRLLADATQDLAGDRHQLAGLRRLTNYLDTDQLADLVEEIRWEQTRREAEAAKQQARRHEVRNQRTAALLVLGAGVSTLILFPPLALGLLILGGWLLLAWLQAGPFI
jgi:hypothetical protein